MAKSEPTTGVSADAIELLTADHRAVEQWFEQFEAAEPSSDSASRAAGEIVQELSVHAAIEEQVLYPTLRDSAANGSELADHALEEHQEVKNLLADVDGKPVDASGVRDIFRTLRSRVQEHVSEEEGETFPALRDALSEDRLHEMGRAIEQAKGMAPTHPHPHAPDTPPANVIAAPAAAMIDKVRDAARDALGS